MPITFETDSVAAGEIREPELAATWASLRIRLDDSVITRVVGRRAQTVRDQVYVPLYPLPESLVSNWWFLLHEVGNPVTNDDDAFRRPHALVSVRDGYAFPKLQVASSGARTVLAWTSESLRWAKLDYQRENYVWIDRNDFRQTCADLVDRVIRRLVACGIDGTFLQEWAPVQAADEDESRFCRTATGLGWDPYAPTARNECQWTSTPSNTSCHRTRTSPRRGARYSVRSGGAFRKRGCTPSAT